MADEDDLQKSLDAAAKPLAGKKITPPRAKATVTPPSPKESTPSLAKTLAPAARQQAAKQDVVIPDTFTHDTALHMAFLGAGQGGGRIANAFWQLGYRRVGIFNTTDTDFEGLDPEVPTLSLDIGGAAKDMQFARQSLRGREEEIRDLMIRSWGNTFDCAVICVGLGGGSGSGCALPLIQAARRYMEDKGRPVRVGAIVSLPSPAEGQQVCRNALAAFKELLDAKISPLLIIDNARIHQLYRPAMSKLLPTSNEIISQLFHLFNTLAASRSPHITFDRSEFTQLMDGGIVVLGSADIPVEEIKTPADVSKAIREQLATSVLAQVDLGTGRKAACVFVASADVLDTLSLDFFDAGYTQLDRIVGSTNPVSPERPTVIHRGLYPSDTAGLACYTMISELAPPYERLKGLAKVAVVQEAVIGMAKYLGV